MTEDRPYKIRTFDSNVSNSELEGFLNSVDHPQIFSLVKSCVIHKDAAKDPQQVNDIIFGRAYPSTTGGLPEMNVPMYGSEIRIAYQERPQEQP
ncbi:hypothetical protein CMI38_01145 [Candidatus Pacearchaeota archaeon]|jgi:hypothetical protein|nr:hypothetical protein [Candidatus Pacearchaeota archaeon]|tara:strand:- start:1063 stop:1344 length:282 start_codon:yes stop_codon:yes gene_type:complete